MELDDIEQIEFTGTTAIVKRFKLSAISYYGKFVSIEIDSTCPVLASKQAKKMRPDVVNNFSCRLIENRVTA